MGVFDANGDAGTFDYQAGDVGYVPRPMGHYVVNRGTTTLRVPRGVPERSRGGIGA